MAAKAAEASLGVPLEELDGLPSSAFVAKAFTGAKLVKGFNHLIAATLAADPIVEGGHRVAFLSSDDEDATAPVAALAKQLGFAPVKLGKLNEGGALVHARGALGASSSSRKGAVIEGVPACRGSRSQAVGHSRHFQPASREIKSPCMVSSAFPAKFSPAPLI
jgi:predicted dinucleotide-binding enzyme